MHNGTHIKDHQQHLGMPMLILLAIEGWKDGEAAAINFSYFSPYDSLWAPLEAAIAQASKQN
jgi:hypothetical protein